MMFLVLAADDHALAMVRSGVHVDLVAPLQSDSVQLQMAALGLLRNLCLPSANKATLLEADMLERLLNLSVTEQPALFKVSTRDFVNCFPAPVVRPNRVSAD